MTPAATPRRSNRTLWLILAVCAAPVIASYAAFYLMPGRDTTNYGELLPTRAAPAIAGTRSDGAAWSLADERGHWVMLFAAPAACDDACAKRLYATRQARTMQGKDRDRVARVWLVPGDDAVAARVRDEHPDVVVVRVAPAAAPALTGGGAIVLVDPLGNQVLAWPADPDIRGVAKDLQKLLRTSRIG